MHEKQQFCNSLSRSMAAVSIALILALALVSAQSAQAQVFHVLYRFTAGADGAFPTGITMDRGGNLYGTAAFGGNNDRCPSGCGTVFGLAHSGWRFEHLYSFAGGEDGRGPSAGVILAKDGSLYGTTASGGVLSCNYGAGCGTVFKLVPPGFACHIGSCVWTNSVLYRFTGPDGALPYGTLTSDPSGNLYGTTLVGGTAGPGTAYEVGLSSDGWTESVLYSFGTNYMYGPLSGMTLDHVGNLYGTTEGGNMGWALYGQGTVFELTPSGDGWTEKVLHSFQGGNDGYQPQSTPVLDESGNLYGTTSGAGVGGGGTVFKLSPSGGGWTYSIIHSFSGDDGAAPTSLAIDANGNLYGTAGAGGSGGQGTVFKLTPSGNGWTYTLVHVFSGSDGVTPMSLIIDSNGTLYGIAFGGGPCCGTVWEITP